MLAEDEGLAPLSWEVLGIAHSHTSNHDRICLEDISSVIASLDTRAREAGAELRWAIGQHMSTEFLEDVERVLPRGCSLRRRSSRPEVNFGCVDCLTTLGELRTELKSSGIVLFSGRFGAVAGILLRE